MFSWFDKLIAGMWIVLMLAFGSMLVLGDFGGVRMLQQQAGILITKATKSSIWVTQQIKLGLVEPIEASAFSEALLFTLLTQAAITLMKRLVQAFFGAIKRILSKFKEMISQGVAAISNSKIARNLAKILNFRINACEEVDKWVNRQLDTIPFFKTSSIENTFKYAWDSTGNWFNNNLSWATPQPVYAQSGNNCEYRLFPQIGTTAQGAINCDTAIKCETANTLRATTLGNLGECAIGNEIKCREGLGKAESSLAKLKAESAPIFDAESCGLYGLLASIQYNKDGTCKYSEAKLGVIGPVNNALEMESLISIAKEAGKAATYPEDQIVKIDDKKNGNNGYIPASFANQSIDISGPIKLGTTQPAPGSALNNFVGGEKVVTVQKLADQTQAVSIATNSIGQATSTSGAGADLSGAIDALIDTVIQELTNIALEVLDTIFNAINTITCGVLNFQDFCNATTQLSSQVTKGAIQYFDNLRTSLIGKVATKEVENIKLGTYLDRGKNSSYLA